MNSDLRGVSALTTHRDGNGAASLPKPDIREILEREVRLLETQTKLEAMDAALAVSQERERGLQEQIERLRTDLRQQRSATVAAIRETEKLRRSFHYRFGKALIDSFTSLRGLAHLPGAIADILRDAARRRRAHGRRPAHDDETTSFATKPLIDAMRQKGLDGARAAIEKLDDGDLRRRAALLSELARLSESTNPTAAIDLAREAVALDPRPFRTKQLAFLLANQGHIAEPLSLLESLPAADLERFKPSEKLRRERIGGMARLAAQQIHVPAQAAVPAFEAAPRRVLFIASSAMPHHLSGYTRRTHALVAGARRNGWDVVFATRPGYPDDRTDVLTPEVAAQIDLEGIEAMALAGPSLVRTPMDKWVAVAADLIEAKARELRPAVIHAPSNWQNALPALIAARRLGIPFVYGVRGFWEMTRASRQPDWIRSEEYRLSAELENLVAGAAERVVTQSDRLADILVRRGVERERIVIVPNGSNAEPLAPEEASEARASLGLDRTGFWIGYVGSVVDYEGVDDLVRAVAMMVEDGIDARAVIAGEGNARGIVAALADDLGIVNRVVILGAVAPAVGEKVLAACDVIALPRHSFAVTDLVEPLKPAEAMASRRPLVASDVMPHRDVVTDGGTGLLHRAGDARDLVAKLSRVARDPVFAAELADRALEFARTNRRWANLVPQLEIAWIDAIAAKPVDSGELRLQPAAAPTPEPASPAAGILPMPPNARVFSESERRMFAQLADTAYKVGGFEQLHELAQRQGEGHAAIFRARCLVLAAAAARRRNDLVGEMTLLEEARSVYASPATWRPLARAYWYRGDIAPARALISRLEEAEVRNPTAETAQLKQRIDQRATLMEADHGFIARHGAPDRVLTDVRPNSAAYFLHFTLPYASNGYATRSHGLLKALVGAGTEVQAFSRAGFPLDTPAYRNLRNIPETDVIDRVNYHRLLGGSRVDDAELDYLLHSADQYEQAIRWLRPSVVHAASNYTTGLPALLAARRTGLPFIYEVRGFWEITRATRQSEFEQNPQYEMIRRLESLVAREADWVITLTDGMRQQLIEGGVPAERCSVVANSVDPSVFRKLPRDAALADRLRLPEGVPVIGYIGSIVGYEGLDDLVSAAAMLRDAGRDFRILLVGDGEAQPAVMELVRKLGLADRVVAPGRVPSTEVPSYYSLIDISPFPRKPLQLCEIVSPLKPFEALAMHKAVVASNVAALAEIVNDGQTGLLFRKGNVDDLARALGELIDSEALRTRLGDAGRAWIEGQRSWSSAGEAIATIYRQLGERDRKRLGA